MIWRPAVYADLHRVTLQVRQWDQDGRSLIPDDARTRTILHDCARTALVDDEVVAVIGVDPMWKGVAAAWAFLSHDALEHPIALTRGTMRWLEWIENDRQLWRVQADVDSRSEKARQWLVRMGFVYEGTMRHYGYHGADHDLYARVRL